MTKIRIFSGRSYPALAHEIGSQLDAGFGDQITFPEYANGCFEIILRENVKDCLVFLVQTSTPQNLDRDLWELLQMVNAAKENDAKEVIIVMPYVSYARSDKKDKAGMTIAGKLLIKLLKASGMTRFIGIDFHSKSFEDFFAEENIKAYNLSALPILSGYLKTKRIIDGVVVSGDEGSFNGAILLAQKLNLPVGVAKKNRIDDKHVIIEDVVGEVSGKDVIILDDEISTGTTIATLGKKLEELSARTLTIAVTHGVFVGKAIENLRSLSILKEIVFTNTLPISKEVRESLPVQFLSVADLIAEKIKEISEES